MKAPVAHWLNRKWQYIPAASHVDSTAFRQRQQERAKAALAATKRRKAA